ncbi:magnesium transporter CorA family protein [Candidatus Saccharibacteria bacterium]|nr:magnesium transporter CorA family protein [Candidatus Saccharibacteria bacterium]MCB9821480.1 magnesium transporter CorA family protein [Candidatus Nomurabacteria bacterium]
MLIAYDKRPGSPATKLPKVKKGSWVRIVSQSIDEVESYAKQLKLDEDALIDGIDLYESPRIEHYDGATYLYVRYCEPSGNLTSTEPLLIIVSKDNLVTVARKAVNAVEEMLKSDDTYTANKSLFVLQLLTRINRGYRNYINGVTRQIFATRNRLEKKIISNDDVLGFIDTEEDLNEFLAALMPYGLVLKAMATGRLFNLSEEDHDLLEDLELSTNELIELSKSRLKTMQNIREAYTTIATNNLNKIFKRLTSITIFLMVPTIISGIYGMNVHLPLSGHANAFWLISISTLLMIVLIVMFFKKQRWL